MSTVEEGAACSAGSVSSVEEGAVCSVGSVALASGLTTPVTGRLGRVSGPREPQAAQPIMQNTKASVEYRRIDCIQKTKY